jgi:hypothetical protein
VKKTYGFYGVTMVELAVVIFIFSFFMIGVYTVMDAGMKSWQMGETKTDLNQKAQVVMNCITKDFRYSTWLSTEIDNCGDPAKLNEYICFETPVNNHTGTFDYNLSSFNSPVWQGYVIYYIYPRWKVNPSSDIKRNLYRHYKPRTTPGSAPITLSSANILSNIDITTPPSGDMIRTVAREIYLIDFEQSKTALTVTINFKKAILKNSTVTHNYANSVNNTEINEIVELKVSIIPQN